LLAQGAIFAEDHEFSTIAETSYLSVNPAIASG
jgi:hypothetical protein